MKAYINKSQLVINGEVPIELEDQLKDCNTYQRPDGTFYIEEDKYIPVICLTLTCFYVLVVNTMEDYYYTPGGYTILKGSDSQARLAGLINSLHYEIQSVEDIYQVPDKLRVLADMIDAYNFPVTLY
jgi:hypothetical protein